MCLTFNSSSHGDDEASTSDHDHASRFSCPRSVCLLGGDQTDRTVLSAAEILFLGMYPDMYFTEKPAIEAIKTFNNRLEEVTKIIKSRNEKLPLPYWYLSPDKIPNSVAI
ncbi:Polyunsaturated fatty acid 5-lipoxygenase [Labeo rohita]|uniref:Polyunsaturated fatty acid 5-lipoxygenase n=1 Tax=Labeo rohita TaxID=84645 RepID=A0ABQ8MTI6_LABRO|nr:Polyunsaturated fatty acid 5-lipoxygenase [Labeo rohita]